MHRDKDGFYTFETVFGSHSGRRPDHSARTSITHPLKIAEVRPSSTSGLIGVTFAPGKKDDRALTGAWNRDLEVDVAAIKVWGASAIVTLIEKHEFDRLQVRELPNVVKAAGIEWYHLPIRDVSVPTPEFERQWVTVGRTLRGHLRNGRNVLLHCRGGLGRAGMIAARLMVELGHDPDDAIQMIRDVRPGAIETPEQVAYVRRLGSVGNE